MKLIKIIPNTIKYLLITVALALSLQGGVLAAPYGSGAYGSCPEQEDCSANGSGSSGSTPSGNTDQPSGSVTVLNNYDDFFSDDGVDLTQKKSSVVYFDVTGSNGSERHSVTVKQIGDDFVIIILASEPIEATLHIGETQSFDVNGDGKSDIQIRLDNIKDGQAYINYKSLYEEDFNTPTPAPSSAAKSGSNSTNRWLLISSIVLLITGLLVFIILKRRRKKDDWPPSPTNTNL